MNWQKIPLALTLSCHLNQVTALVTWPCSWQVVSNWCRPIRLWLLQISSRSSPCPHWKRSSWIWNSWSIRKKWSLSTWNMPWILIDHVCKNFCPPISQTTQSFKGSCAISSIKMRSSCLGKAKKNTFATCLRSSLTKHYRGERLSQLRYIKTCSKVDFTHIFIDQ